MLALMVVATDAPAHDDEHRRHDHNRDSQHRHKRRADHEVAREAFTAGQIRPLEQVLAEVRETAPGDIVGVELDQRDTRWVYIIKVITPDGSLRRISIDARRPPGTEAVPAPPAGREPSRPLPR
jgi:uncharacterized membrane protein YkoI